MTRVSAETTVQLDERVYRTELPGGPVVLSEQIPGVRSAAVGVWVRWGSSHESSQLLGISHLLEHMVFKGTEKRSAKEIAYEIEALGGSLDAYTAREHTAYHARVLDEHLPVAIDVLTDMVFHPTLRDSDLAVERSVILEEIAGVEDIPEELVFDLSARSVWGDHPYGNPVLGTRETVERITQQDLFALWDAAYRPSACVVAAAGNVRHNEVLELVAQAFPDNSKPSPAADVPEPTPVSPTDDRIHRDTAQVHVCMGSATFPHADPRRYAAALVSTAIGGGMSSRLFQRVREERGLAYAVYSFQSFYARGGHAGVYMATRPDAAEQAIEEVRAELGELATSGMPADELQAVKNQAKGQVVLSLESTSARLLRLAGVALYEEPYLTLDELCSRFDAIREEQVAELCATYDAPERQTVVRLGPDAADKSN